MKILEMFRGKTREAHQSSVVSAPIDVQLATEPTPMAEVIPQRQVEPVAVIEPETKALEPTCNICQSTQFKAGPAGRVTNGFNPHCVKCASLERHRVFRAMFDRLHDDTFKGLNTLMFSMDGSVHHSWFKSFTNNYYKENDPNSLDIQKLNLADSAYDVVICNHILEHVQDYRAALSELVRVTSQEGFLFLSFPHPPTRVKTNDWGYPKPEQHGHFRVFGSEVETEMAEIWGAMNQDISALRLVDKDPVTGATDWAYVVSKNRNTIMKFATRSPGCKLLI